MLHKIKNFYEPKSASFTKPTIIVKGDVVIKGMLKYDRIKYGIEKYFIPEGTPEPSSKDLTVELSIYKNGRVRISKVFLKDKIWP